MQYTSRFPAFLAITLPAVVIDRLSKFWAANWLVVQTGGAAEAWPGVFGFLYAENTGMAFSALSGATGLLAAFSIVMVAAIAAYLLLAKSMPRLLLAGLSLVAAGGAGNLWDRLFYGYVIDFINLEFMRFAVFNAADIFVCCGAGLIILHLFLTDAKPKEAKT